MEKYNISPVIKSQGYFTKIQGKTIEIQRGLYQCLRGETALVLTADKVNMLKLQPISTIQKVDIIIDGDIKGRNYFIPEDLTPEELHQLVQARVIVLTKEQGMAYNKWYSKWLHELQTKKQQHELEQDVWGE